MNNYKQIFGKLVDTEAILDEAYAIAGVNPSMELVMALTVRDIALTHQHQINELKNELFTKTATIEDLQGKTTNVVSLTDARNTKNANENLQHVVSAWGDMTPEAIQSQLDAQAEFNHDRKQAAALNKDITLGDLNDPEAFDSKNVYLTIPYGPGKIDMIIGIHAVGFAGQHQYTQTELDGSKTTKSTDFQIMEIWGNEYDENHNMLGRGSFRIHHHDFDQVIKDYESEGWTRREKPVAKIPTDT